MKRIYSDLILAVLLVIVFAVPGTLQYWKWPNSAFALPVIFIMWPLLCGLIIGSYSICIWKLLEKQGEVWFNLCEIGFILLWPHLASVAISIVLSPHEDIGGIMFGVFCFIYLPALFVSIISFTMILLIGTKRIYLDLKLTGLLVIV